jgi:hypothetical protein
MCDNYVALRTKQMSRSPLSRAILRLAEVGLLGLIVVSAMSALASANTVPETVVKADSLPITANDLKPAQCNGIDLSHIVTDGIGTSGNDLVLGNGDANTLNGGGGNDCLVGGAGNDVLIGGAGIDVCTGGTGIDTYDSSCETTN